MKSEASITASSRSRSSCLFLAGSKFAMSWTTHNFSVEGMPAGGAYFQVRALGVRGHRYSQRAAAKDFAALPSPTMNNFG